MTLSRNSPSWRKLGASWKCATTIPTYREIPWRIAAPTAFPVAQGRRSVAQTEEDLAEEADERLAIQREAELAVPQRIPNSVMVAGLTQTARWLR